MKIKISAILDRIEGQKAVFLIKDGDSIELQQKMLPKGLIEGDIVSIIINKEDKKTNIEKDKVKGLIERLEKRK